MGIEKKDPANFSPSVEIPAKVDSFRFWCQKVLPLVYDDSLSYYELLCKVVNYLNNTIADVNTLGTDVDNLNRAYNELQSYVNNYFSTLDVQNEINNKLDVMAQDGSLSALIQPLFDTYKTEIDGEVNQQNNRIDVLENRMNTFTSLPSGSTSGDAELIDIRVGADSTVYSSAGESVRAQFRELKKESNNLDDKISNDIYEISHKLYTQTYGVNVGYVYNRAEKLDGHGFKGSTEFILNGHEKTMQIKATIKEWHNVYTFIDENENVLKYKRNDTNAQANFDELVSVPKYAKKLIISTGIMPTPPINIDVMYEDIKFAEQQKTKQLLVGVGCHGFFVNGNYNNGDVLNVQSIKFDVSSLDRVFLYMHTSKYYDSYALVDNNGSLISFKNSGEIERDIEQEIMIPSNCKYLYVSGNNERTLRGVRLYAFKSLIKSDFYGKKIVWFGTSIPAGGLSGYDNLNSYPMRVGSLLGANVFNESIGSSTVHCSTKEWISNSNPYGIMDNFEAVSRCLTNTLEMQNWIINALETKSFPFKNCPESLSEDDKEFIRNCSYERKLDKYLTEENKPDVWVFDHGHNEYFYKEESYDDNSPYDKSTFRGAMNFLINRIREFDPKARIIIISDYDNQKYPDITKNQKIVAEDWNYPYYEIYKDLGWSNRTIKTKGMWIQGFWFDNYNNEFRDTTSINIWCADGLHPHSDYTGKALDLIAKSIAHYFSKIAVQ